MYSAQFSSPNLWGVLTTFANFSWEGTYSGSCEHLSCSRANERSQRAFWGREREKFVKRGASSYRPLTRPISPQSFEAYWYYLGHILVEIIGLYKKIIINDWETIIFVCLNFAPNHNSRANGLGTDKSSQSLKGIWLLLSMSKYGRKKKTRKKKNHLFSPTIFSLFGWTLYYLQENLRILFLSVFILDPTAFCALSHRTHSHDK